MIKHTEDDISDEELDAFLKRKPTLNSVEKKKKSIVTPIEIDKNTGYKKYTKSYIDTSLGFSGSITIETDGI